MPTALITGVTGQALSFSQPELTANVTGTGAARMLEAIRLVGGTRANPVRFYQASSSEMFGKVRETPQSELTPFHPRSPYACAKAYGHHMTVNHRESFGLHASNGNPLQPRVRASWHRVRDAEDHQSRGSHPPRPAGSHRARQPRCASRLGPCRGLRARHVGDAPARRARARLGWTPTTDLPTLVERMVHHDLELERPRAAAG